MKSLRHLFKGSLVLLLILSLALLAGCGGGGQQPSSPGEENGAAAGDNWPSEVTLAGSAPTGTWYIYQGAVAEVINRHIPDLYAIPTPSAGSVENARNLAKGEINIGLMLPDAVVAAYTGTEMFEGEPIEKLRVMHNCYTFPMHVIVMDNSPIQSVEDMKGKKIGVGLTGATERYVAEWILEHHDISLDEVTLVPLSVEERAQALTDRQIDAVFILTGITSSTIQELTTAFDARYVPIAEDKLASLNAEYSYIIPSAIPAKTYKGQDEDISAVYCGALQMTTTDMPESLIYEITKATYENTDELIEIVSLAEQLTLESALQGAPIPVHPGAEKYFKEKGVLD